MNNAYFLDERELRILARHPLASIGGHTTSHAALTTLDESSARAELLDNRNYLQDLLQSPIRHVAYPYGAYGPREEHLAGEVGFHTAVTTWQARLYDRKANYFALPRIGAYSRSGFRTRMGGIIEAVQANGLTRSFPPAKNVSVPNISIGSSARRWTPSLPRRIPLHLNR